MDKEAVYQFLSAHQIPYEITEHKAVFNMEELHFPYLPAVRFYLNNQNPADSRFS